MGIFIDHFDVLRISMGREILMSPFSAPHLNFCQNRKSPHYVHHFQHFILWQVAFSRDVAISWRYVKTQRFTTQMLLWSPSSLTEAAVLCVWTKKQNLQSLIFLINVVFGPVPMSDFDVGSRPVHECSGLSHCEIGQVLEARVVYLLSPLRTYSVNLQLSLRERPTRHSILWNFASWKKTHWVCVLACQCQSVWNISFTLMFTEISLSPLQKCYPTHLTSCDSSVVHIVSSPPECFAHSGPAVLWLTNTTLL